MNQNATTKENYLIFTLNGSTVEESSNKLNALSEEDKIVLLNSKKDGRFGDNLLIAISLLDH